MADDLKLCPFCGGPAYLDDPSWSTSTGESVAWVTCSQCNTYGPTKTTAEATGAWNTRAGITLEQAAQTILDAGCSGVSQMTWAMSKHLNGRDPIWPAGDARHERPTLHAAITAALLALAGKP